MFLFIVFRAGAGRTGTFIAAWILLQSIDKSDPQKVYDVVRRLRDQRPLMVNTRVGSIKSWYPNITLYISEIFMIRVLKKVNLKQ